MAEVGGMLAAAILKVVGDQIGSAIGGQIKLMKNFDEDLKKMKMALESVDTVLEDAEKRSIADKSTLLWLKRLKDLMYAISDMIDEFEVDKQPSARKLAFKKYLAIMIPCLTIVPNIRMANKMDKMMTHLKVITDQHKDFKSAKDTNANEPKVTDIRETTSMMGTQIVGRTMEKEEILASLSQSMHNSITILPICGIGGLGKTTLATMVYNSSQFKEYSPVWVYVSQTFDLINIGNSIISQLSKEKKESKYTGMQMIHNSLQDLLAYKKILIVLDDLWEGDVFRLESLKDMLKIGERSNVLVIVTTRDEDIANKISTIQPYKLTPLSDDMCWSIIKQKSAFESRDDKEQLEEIGKVIARKCCGVALAANCLGHTLKSMKPNAWESVRDSNIWTVSSSTDTPYPQVLASLKLSYSAIPSYLKICFAYCAIFPKGHKIIKDDLINQWISLGFCTRQLGERYISQLLGLSFLEHSKSSSTIEIYVEDITFLTMHDLVHDLARSVMGEEILIAGEKGDAKGSYYHYALLNDCSKSLSSELSKIRALRFMECGQTELHDAAFLSAKSLRVLDLSECSIHTLPNAIGALKQLRYLNAPRIQQATIPDSITRLSKLIFLNLHRSFHILALPKSIGDIEGLLYLNLSVCIGIRKLPESFGRLKELVHLDFSDCLFLRGIPEFLSRFSQLKYLNLSGCGNTVYYVHEALVGLTHLEYLNLKDTNARWIPGDLTKLRYLNLSLMRNFLAVDFVRIINHICSNFFDLEHLDLSSNSEIHSIPESIGSLRKLHTFDLSKCYNLYEIPESVGRIDSLKFLYLNGCQRIKELPQLSSSAIYLPKFVVQPGYFDSGSNLVQLQPTDPIVLQITKLENVKSAGEAQRIKLMEKKNLEVLTLEWTRDVERSVDERMLLEKLMPPSTLKKLEICGYNGVRFPAWVVGQLPNLKELVLRDMASLEEWDTSYSSAEEDVIERLEIYDCPKLRMKPLPPRAKSWEISNSDNVLSSWEECTASHTNASSSSSLMTIKLSVKDCNVPINQWRLLQHLSGRISLRISSCGDLTGSSETRQYLSSVETLHLQYQDLEELPEWIGELTSLQNLQIYKCTRLMGLQDNMRQLIKLQSLRLEDCKNMASLPHWLGELTSLKNLVIWNCDVLRCFPESIQQVTSLQTLNVAGCSELKHFFESEEEGKMDLNHNQEKVCVLPISLEELCIQCCEGIKSLPDGIQQLTNLQELSIRVCPQLKEWCELEENQMKLAHIKEKRFW